MWIFQPPWIWILLATALAVSIWLIRRSNGRNSSIAKEQNQRKAESNTKTKGVEYLCRQCSQHFKPPALFYACPVCGGQVDKFDNGKLVHEHNPKFPSGSTVLDKDTLPFVRKDDRTDNAPRKSESYRDNVVALNLKAVNALHMTCWVVVTAESASLAEAIANQSQNFRVLHKKKPVSLGKKRWLVWGKARSAA